MAMGSSEKISARFEGWKGNAVYVKKLADSLDPIDAVYRRRIEG